MQNIGTPIDTAALEHVHGGGLKIIGGPGDDHTIQLTPEQLKTIGHVVYEAGKLVVSAAKSVWHTISSWF